MALTPKPQSAYPSNGWWMARDTNGAIVLTKGNNPGNDAVSSVYIGAADSIADLETNFSTGLAKALGSVGGNGQQQAALITEIDHAAGLNSATARIVVQRGIKAGSDSDVTATDAKGNPVSTATTSEADSAGIPTPSIDPGAELATIWAALSNPSNWLRALELLGGVVLVYLALKSVTGISAPSVPKIA